MSPRSTTTDLTKRPTWSLEQFQTAAAYASRPRRGIAGFYIAPTLRGLAPFIYSGGGNVFDNDDEPTSLAFSSDDTKSALEEVLPLLRDPKLSLTPEMLSEKTPLEWFREGRLGMIAGFRDLVPGAAADRCPRLRRHADAGGRRRGDRRRPDRHLHRPGHRRRGRVGRLPGQLHLDRVGERGRGRGLPRPRQHGGGAVRRLPAGRPRPRACRACSTTASETCGSRRS